MFPVIIGGSGKKSKLKFYLPGRGRNAGLEYNNLVYKQLETAKPVFACSSSTRISDSADISLWTLPFTKTVYNGLLYPLGMGIPTGRNISHCFQKNYILGNRKAQSCLVYIMKSGKKSIFTITYLYIGENCIDHESLKWLACTRPLGLTFSYGCDRLQQAIYLNGAGNFGVSPKPWFLSKLYPLGMTIPAGWAFAWAAVPVAKY